jgi:CHAT domain-containing protein
MSIADGFDRKRHAFFVKSPSRIVLSATGVESPPGAPSASGGYARLPFSGGEIREIARLLQAGAENVHLGAAANEATVKQASADGRLRRARYVHFATHGTLGATSRAATVSSCLCSETIRKTDCSKSAKSLN